MHFNTWLGVLPLSEMFLLLFTASPLFAIGFTFFMDVRDEDDGAKIR